MFTKHEPKSLAISTLFCTFSPRRWGAGLLYGHIQELILFGSEHFDCLAHVNDPSLVDPN